MRTRRLGWMLGAVSIAWFIVWLIANNVGGNEPLTFDPVNGWAAALILSLALDVNRPQVIGRKRS